MYDGLIYKLSLTFPNGYPFTAPTVKFVTPCFHPNVDTFGNICLDILKDKWSALYDVRTILLSIQSLLGDPNNDSPLNGQAAHLWSDQVAYKKLLLEKFQNTKSWTQSEVLYHQRSIAIIQCHSSNVYRNSWFPNFKSFNCAVMVPVLKKEKNRSNILHSRYFYFVYHFWRFLTPL